MIGNFAVFGWYRYDSKKEFGGNRIWQAGFSLCAEVNCLWPRTGNGQSLLCARRHFPSPGVRVSPGSPGSCGRMGRSSVSFSAGAFPGRTEFLPGTFSACQNAAVLRLQRRSLRTGVLALWESLSGPERHPKRTPRSRPIAPVGQDYRGLPTPGRRENELVGVMKGKKKVKRYKERRLLWRFMGGRPGSFDYVREVRRREDCFGRVPGWRIVWGGNY